ncbi:MAG TPA: hypothetical protein VLP43_12675 [Solirubrobacteraceae bacterium]|nr:hypothetical protein [Solirubrobacteraceae bacterium]
MDHRDQRIIVETARLRITGGLRLPRDGYRSRLTDYLNSADVAFLPLTDVVLESLDGAFEPRHRSYVAVSLSQLVVAMPVDDEPAADPG